MYRGDGLNLYAYCANNPVKYYDPSGYMSLCPGGKTFPGNGDGGDGADVNWTNHGYKHFPEKNKSWQDTVKSTKNGPAKYSPDIKDIEKIGKYRDMMILLAQRTGKKHNLEELKIVPIRYMDILSLSLNILNY